MNQVVVQLWTDGKNFRKSYHRSKDDIQAFAREEYDRGPLAYVQSGTWYVASVKPKVRKAVDESKYGIWM